MASAVAVQLFSQFDIMDGQRARRQKSGSPLGRIVDEALDMPQQAIWCLFILYACRFESTLAVVMIALMTNFTFYTMEMRFLMFGNLDLNIGEFGPVETEWLVASIIGLVGYLGPDCMQSTLGSVVGLSAENMLAGV
jgi:phosphatidylglycerophosphate synthase